jgi:hypothetical protein
VVRQDAARHRAGAIDHALRITPVRKRIRLVLHGFNVTERLSENLIQGYRVVPTRCHY